MNIGEIISDSLGYPLNNLKALLLYIVLGIIAGLVLGATGAGAILAGGANNGLALGAIAIVGIIVTILIELLIAGYMLDVVKYGINRRNDAPGIEIGRNITNGIKLILIKVVYYIIPAIITIILGFIFRGWLTNIIGIILFIIFALAEFMAKCRLAQTDSLGYSLSIGEAIGDISRVGLIKIIGTVIIIAIITVVLVLIGTFVMRANAIAGGIVLGILGVYLEFFTNRATGLLYSDA